MSHRVCDVRRRRGSRTAWEMTMALSKLRRSRAGHRTATAVTVLALTLGVTGGVVVAAGSSDDEQALEPARPPASTTIEARVSDLLAQMTTEEKLQQVQLLSDGQITDERRRGRRRRRCSAWSTRSGSTTSSTSPSRSRGCGIPILFAYDTIHGYRTIFPVPLGAASSLRPGGRRRPTHDRRPRVGDWSGSSRSTARWSTSRTSRAGAASSRATARTRTSAR